MLNKVFIFFAMFLGIIGFSNASTQFTLFEQEGISLSIPVGQEWKELSNQKIQEIKENATKIDGLKRRSDTLLILESNTGKIRLSTKPLYDASIGLENDLAELLKPESLSDKKEFIADMLEQQKSIFKRLEQKSNMKISNINISLNEINRNIAIVISYIRSSNDGKGDWYVNQYHFTDSNNKRTIIFTLSHSVDSDANVKLTLDKVLSSLKF